MKKTKKSFKRKEGFHKTGTCKHCKGTGKEGYYFGEFLICGYCHGTGKKY